MVLSSGVGFTSIHQPRLQSGRSDLFSSRGAPNLSEPSSLGSAPPRLARLHLVPAGECAWPPVVRLDPVEDETPPGMARRIPRAIEVIHGVVSHAEAAHHGS